jgi:hypothetical protein
MANLDQFQSTLDWLLEVENLGVQYLARRDLIPAGASEMAALQRKAHSEGPIAAVLAAMKPEGYWVQPGSGYNPKYTSTVWSIILLSQLGASVETDSRVAAACSYTIEHTLNANGQFTTNGLPSGTVDCLQGNLCTALLDMGIRDPRLDKAFEWMARTITGEGIAPMEDKAAAVRYYAGKCGPNFACGGNNKMPCAWGAVKVMLAFSKLPLEKRTPLIDSAIQSGVDFLLGTDPGKAGYPCGWAAKPSGNWWKFGFPVFYVTDLLQNVEALVNLGYGRDPRLFNALKIIREKQEAKGRWPLEYHYNGKTWIDSGPSKQPNKWVTLRALRVLKEAE